MSVKSISEKPPILAVPWAQIEENLHTLIPAEGGNTDAKRGVITLPDSNNVFIKIGTNEHTKRWAAKEIESYAFLAEHGYSHIPHLLSINADKTGFAIDALLTADGWDWSNTWSKERVDATLAAMDALAAITPDSKYTELLKPIIKDTHNGWPKLLANIEDLEGLQIKLQSTSAYDVVENLTAHVEKAAAYTLSHDTLVHDDVRADNCAWNKTTGEAKLVDWNWLELGDRNIDLAAMLVHVHASGFDVLKDHAVRLNPAALHWMAGFWLEAARQPIWHGGPEKLRDTQLRSGITALELSQKLA